MRRLLLALLNRLFRRRGLELRACTPALADAGMAAGLARAGRLAPEIRTVVDIGAAAGKWTELALPHFPEARFLLLEPLRERVAELQALAAREPRTQFLSAVAGAAAGTAQLHVAEDLDGSGVCAEGGRPVPVIALDEELPARGLAGPYLLKLDTHGFEIPILEGARATLASTALLIIEAYNFQLAPGTLRFPELCAWLEARGFRPCDLLEPLRRPGDGLLWQLDLVFARHDHPAFARTTYR